jgi:hypothetical protein
MDGAFRYLRGDGDIELVGETKTWQAQLHPLGFLESNTHVFWPWLSRRNPTERQLVRRPVNVPLIKCSTKKPGSKLRLTMRGPRLLMLLCPHHVSWI